MSIISGLTWRFFFTQFRLRFGYSAQSVAECERILASAEQAGTTFMISEQSQYWAPVVLAKELIDAGVIGNVTSVR